MRNWNNEILCRDFCAKKHENAWKQTLWPIVVFMTSDLELSLYVRVISVFSRPGKCTGVKMQERRKAKKRRKNRCTLAYSVFPLCKTVQTECALLKPSFPYPQAHSSFFVHSVQDEEHQFSHDVARISSTRLHSFDLGIGLTYLGDDVHGLSRRVVPGCLVVLLQLPGTLQPQLLQ